MSKRYLKLRYRAEIFQHNAIGYVFLYLNPGPHHGRRKGHPHEAHQEDEISIEHHNIYKFHVQFLGQTLIKRVLYLCYLHFAFAIAV